MYKCSIYKDRPQICRDFPSRETENLRYQSCTYWFDINGRQGECSRCGECCMLNKLYAGICPHLELVGDQETN